MSPPSDPRPSRRRVGRRRLPPLAPPPPIQFVVANHPNEFKAGTTMRNVRSHVMYRHREQRGSSPSILGRLTERSGTAASMTRTPSPMTTNSDGLPDDNRFRNNLLAPNITRLPYGTVDSVLYRYASEASSNPLRSLAARIITATTAAPARSAPPIFEEASQFPFPGQATMGRESMDVLKEEYIRTTDFYCHDSSWMQRVCNSRLSFLSHVSVACVYQDLREGRTCDSELTLHARTEALSAFNGRLDADDASLLGITHLLVSELGSFRDDVVNLHFEGLVGTVAQRGGISQLHPSAATTITLVMLSFSILRGHIEPPLLSATTPQPLLSASGIDLGPISPLYAPRGHFSQLYGCCSPATIELLSDMHALTQVYLARGGYASSSGPGAISQIISCDTQLQQLYSRIFARSSTEDDLLPDWIYETCRFAALIYAHSIVYGTSFANSGAVMHTHSSELDSTPTTWLTALHSAIVQTSTDDCWGDMRGVLLWICLIGGAASWPRSRRASLEQGEGIISEQALAKKRFALLSIKAAVSVPFEQAGVMICAQRTMLQVRELVDSNSSSTA